VGSPDGSDEGSQVGSMVGSMVGGEGMQRTLANPSMETRPFA